MAVPVAEKREMALERLCRAEFLMDCRALRPPEDPEIPLWQVGASEVANWKGI